MKAIVSSGYSTDPILADFQKIGFINRLNKPYTYDELLKVLADFVKRYAK